MNGTRVRVRVTSAIRRCVSVVSAGERMTFPHRAWFVTSFVVGVMFCYAFPPFQTNDEDAHWLKMWGVAYGGFHCNAPKPSAAGALYGPLHMGEVRYHRDAWRWQYMRDALKFVGSEAATHADGTACGYPPMAYVVPGLVARFVAFGTAGHLRPGSMLRAAFAARITNWVLFSLATLLVVRRIPWCRNFALFFYSIPEVLQQSMAINTDSYLFVCAAGVLLLTYGARSRNWTVFAMAVIIGLMTATKVVYWPFATVGLVLIHRLVQREGWRARHFVALAVLFALPIAMQIAWAHWRVHSVAGVAAPPDLASRLAEQQAEFVKAHPTKLFTVMVNQALDLFKDDLMRGSWLSIFGAFGWSAFTMNRWGYWLLLLAGVLAIACDAIAGMPSREGEPRSRSSLLVVAVAACSVEVTVLTIIVGMYVYFSAGYMHILFGDEAIGVQGRYYLIPILLWGVMLLYVIRRRTPLSRRSIGLPATLTTTALFCCTLANVMAVGAILEQFYAYR